MPVLHNDVIKPRDIREKLRGKIDPEVGKILVRLAEDQIETRMMVSEIAKDVMGIANLMSVMTKGMAAAQESLSSKLEQLKRTNNVNGVDE